MQPQNLLQIFKASVDKYGRLVCFRYKEGNIWHSLDWKQVYQKVVDLAGGLRKLGVRSGDRVALFSHTRYEWTIADMAILACGGISIPIYESSTSETASYILSNAEVKVVFVDQASQLEKIRQVHKDLPHLKQIVIFDPPKGRKKEEGVYTLDQLFLLGSGVGEVAFKEAVETLTPESMASYVYTSGTTGPPKGVMLTHGNFLGELLATQKVFDLTPSQEALLFLPLAHIFARVIQFVQFQRGFVQCYAESIDKLLDNIAEVRPHFIGTVPRIFEKVHTRVMQGVEAGSAAKKKIFNWAMDVGRQRSRTILNRKSVPFLLQLKWLVAHRLVFSKLHQKMGGRIAFFISGGAPLSLEIAEFFHSAGFVILEGYGLTETTAAITCNILNDYQVGVVGKPLPGVAIKIADDGEILVKGELVFKGYYKKPEDTALAIVDGWFHTGDIGIFDQQGFLKITDRKKDIIVTAGGKNIAPQNIESFIKTDPLISQVMVHGDKRKFLSALITLDQHEVTHYAKDHHIQFDDYSELVKNEKIYQLIKARIEEKNKQLAKYESIKKFAILDRDFSVESGELTPTLKVKRKFTSEKYRDILDKFYKE